MYRCTYGNYGREMTIGIYGHIRCLRQRHQYNSSTCDLCDTDDVQDEQHVLFHCANPHMYSLRRKYAYLFPPTAAHYVSPFLSQDNNKL